MEDWEKKFEEAHVKLQAFKDELSASIRELMEKYEIRIHQADVYDSNDDYVEFIDQYFAVGEFQDHGDTVEDWFSSVIEGKK